MELLFIIIFGPFVAVMLFFGWSLVAYPDKHSKGLSAGLGLWIIVAVFSLLGILVLA